MESRCPSCSRPIDGSTVAADSEAKATACVHCGYDLSVLDQDPELTAHYIESEEFAAERTVGNFRLIKRLGQGAFGAVWLAEDTNLNRPVALKLPKPRRSNDVLLHEAKTAAKLKHPNIVSIYEVGVDHGQVFIASEHIDGEDLKAELDRGRPSIARAITLVEKLASAVQHAHSHGVIHRDLKPANIMIDSSGEPYVADFGIAKQVDTNETISSDGAVVGTISYMSPEQAKGLSRETDHRSDVYALGAILFEMLTEYLPFRGNSRAILHQKIYEDAPSPRRLVPSLGKDLETICQRCLERDPAKRYQSADELREELTRYREGVPIKARPINQFARAWRWCRRKPMVAGLLTGIISSLTIGLIGITMFWQQARTNAENMQRAWYRASMTAASELLSSGDLKAVQQKLAICENEPQLRPLQDFSYRYLSHACQPYLRVLNHGDPCVDVAVSADGSLVASAGVDRIVRLWNAQSGEMVRQLDVRAGVISAIRFAPDGRRLFSAHASGKILIFNPLQHDRVIDELQHGSGLTTIRISADSKWMVSASKNGRALLWDVKNRSEAFEFDVGKQQIHDVRFSQDGERIAFAVGTAVRDGAVQIWNTQTRELESTIAVSSVRCVAFIDDHTIVAGKYNGAIQYSDLENGETSELRASTGAIGDVEWLPGINRTAVASLYGTNLVNADHQVTRRLQTHNYTFGMIDQSLDASRMVIGSGDGRVVILDVDALAQDDMLWSTAHVRDIQFTSPSDLFFCNGDGAVHRVDIESMVIEQIIPPSDREMLALAFCPAEGLLAAAGMQREIALYDTESNISLSPIALPFAAFQALEFSPDGRFMAAGSRNGSLLVYEVNHWDEPVLEETHADTRINSLCFHPGSSRLSIAQSDGMIITFALSDGRWSEAERFHVDDEPTAISTAERGQLLLVANKSGKILLHELGTGRVRHVVDAHAGGINCVQVFPSGSQFASAGRDRVIRIWNTTTGERISTLYSHLRQVFGMDIAPDGNTIASGSLSGEVRVWRGQ